MEVSTVSLWQQQEENPEGFEVASRKTKGSESRLFLPAASLHNYRDGVPPGLFRSPYITGMMVRSPPVLVATLQKPPYMTGAASEARMLYLMQRSRAQAQALLTL